VAEDFQMSEDYADSHEMALCLKDRLGSSVAVVGTTRPSTESALMMRVKAPTKQRVMDMLCNLMFCHMRFELFKRANFTFDKLTDTIPDKEPLRFIVPFKFLEPSGRWYRFAPFVIALERTKEAQCLLGVYAESHQNMQAWSEYWMGQVVFDRTTIVPARFNVRWQPWKWSDHNPQ
jgi:hypothetical protein